MRIYKFIRLLGAAGYSLLLFTFVYGRWGRNLTYHIVLAVVTIIVVSVHALTVILVHRKKSKSKRSSN